MTGQHRMEFLFEFIWEFVFQTVVEVLLEVGLHSVRAPFLRRPNVVLASFGYLLFGTIAGILSLQLFPQLLVSTTVRITNLVITPLLVGLLMSVMGRIRRRRGGTVLRINRFIFGYLFALSFALIRYFYAT